jgi:hypothetical protein
MSFSAREGSSQKCSSPAFASSSAILLLKEASSKTPPGFFDSAAQFRDRAINYGQKDPRVMLKSLYQDIRTFDDIKSPVLEHTGKLTFEPA